MMACNKLSSQRQTKCTDSGTYRNLRRNQSKAAEGNQEEMMKTANLRGKGNEREEQEALKKGNRTLMNSATLLKGKPDEKEEGEEKAMLSMWDCGSPLYDSYELVSLNHLIDRHLMAFPSSLHGSKPITTRFTHHSHRMVYDHAAHEIGSQEKFKGSFMVTTFSKFLMKMRRKKKKRKNKDLRTGLAGFVVDFLCGGNRKHT